MSTQVSRVNQRFSTAISSDRPEVFRVSRPLLLGAIHLASRHILKDIGIFSPPRSSDLGVLACLQQNPQEHTYIYIYEEDDAKRRKREESRKSEEVECMQTHACTDRVMRTEE